MSTNEIGSEFWYEDDLVYRDAVRDENNIKYFMSGRTALDYIIEDACYKRDIKSAYLPSYCCDSMIIPFKKHNIDVRFYDVKFDKKEGLKAFIDENVKTDILYVMEYFGFDNRLCVDSINKIANNGAIVILDETHSKLSDINYRFQVDYSFTSFRKWFFVPGIAETFKYSGSFICDSHEGKHINNRYVNMRLSGAKYKKLYIDGLKKDKNKFLSLFHDAEDLLDNDFSKYDADSDSRKIFASIDYYKIKEQRRKNAKFLISEIKKIKGVELIFSTISENECPLFVPIIVKDIESVCERLITNQIYCPRHWPISKYHLDSCRENRLYNNEVSIICDQRYDVDDMKKIIKILRNEEK